MYGKVNHVTSEEAQQA
jgi:hypothetical protein